MALLFESFNQVGFKFSGLVSKNIESFISNNILDTLAFSNDETYNKIGYFTIDLDSVMGSDLCGEFVASAGEITLIKPYSPD